MICNVHHMKKASVGKLLFWHWLSSSAGQSKHEDWHEWFYWGKMSHKTKITFSQNATTFINEPQFSHHLFQIIDYFVIQRTNICKVRLVVMKCRFSYKICNCQTIFLPSIGFAGNRITSREKQETYAWRHISRSHFYLFQSINDQKDVLISLEIS